MINFEYVISGMTMGMSDMYNKVEVLEPYADTFNKKVTHIDNKYSNQNVSMLFNSYCEPKHGETIRELMPSWHHHFSDSGGLQISRSKKGLTPEIRDKIYTHQATYSDIAMIFDDIPVEFDGSNTGWSMKTSTAGRRFVRELTGEKARSTLGNVKRQIEIFNKLESDTKITLIVQGQDVDSYREYIETIVNGLTDEELKSCVSISLASACSGSGFNNRMEMIYACKEFQIPMELKSNVHLLGVGSHDMMTPFFVSPEYFDFVKTLSYDSSTQANSWFFSRYRNKDWKNIEIDSPAGDYRQRRNDSPNTERVTSSTGKTLEQMYTEQLVPSYGELFELNKDAFTKFGIPNLKHLIEESTKWSTKNVEKARLYNSDEGKHGAKLLPFFNQMQVVEHFMDRVQKLTDNPSQIKDRGLSQVKDWDMFINGWLPYQGTMDKLPTEFAGSLSEFF